MSKLRVGVIGAGSMGCKHINALKGMPDLIKLSGFFDIDTAKSIETAKKYKTPYYKDVLGLLDKVDAVVIAVPAPLHFYYGVLCAQNKKHILMEKPLCNSAAAAEELIKICSQNEVILQPGHIERFNPAVASIPDLIKGMDIVSIDFKRSGPSFSSNFDIDIVHDLMIHDLDIVTFIFNDKCEQIYAVGKCLHKSNCPDHGQVTMKLENGIIVNLTASRIIDERSRTIRICGRDSVITIDCQIQAVTVNANSGKKPGGTDFKGIMVEKSINELLINKSDALKNELAAFIHAASTNSCPAVDGTAALKALQLADKITLLICKGSTNQRSE